MIAQGWLKGISGIHSDTPRRRKRGASLGPLPGIPGGSPGGIRSDGAQRAATLGADSTVGSTGQGLSFGAEKELGRTLRGKGFGGRGFGQKGHCRSRKTGNGPFAGRGEQRKTQDLERGPDPALEGRSARFSQRKTVLLHRVTSSGKTELYARLIDQTIRQENKCCTCCRKSPDYATGGAG